METLLLLLDNSSSKLSSRLRSCSSKDAFSSAENFVGVEVESLVGDDVDEALQPAWSQSTSAESKDIPEVGVSPTPILALKGERSGDEETLLQMLLLLKGDGRGEE